MRAEGYDTVNYASGVPYIRSAAKALAITLVPPPPPIWAVLE